MSFTNIVNYGRYYKPANLHYNTTTMVMCDRCKKNDLDACIGYKDQDLCLLCAYQINEMNKRQQRPDESLTRMRTSRFDNEPLTKMKTKRFVPDRLGQENLTNMMTQRFIPNGQENLTYMMSDRFNTYNEDSDLNPPPYHTI